MAVDVDDVAIPLAYRRTDEGIVVSLAGCRQHRDALDTFAHRSSDTRVQSVPFRLGAHHIHYLFPRPATGGAADPQDVSCDIAVASNARLGPDGRNQIEVNGTPIGTPEQVATAIRNECQPKREPEPVRVRLGRESCRHYLTHGARMLTTEESAGTSMIARGMRILAVDAHETRILVVDDMAFATLPLPFLDVKPESAQD